jgi:formate--tetrahydrofolate ligase
VQLRFDIGRTPLGRGCGIYTLAWTHAGLPSNEQERIVTPMSATVALTDLEIARGAALQPIGELAENLAVLDEEFESYGKYVGKLHAPAILDRLKERPNGRYVVVTSMTPTPHGEGKTLTTVGLSMAINRLGKRAVGSLRQPSMGPLFGRKGGAGGGGRSQVLPMETVNLHLTGDTHAVTLAHNLLAAAVDNHLAHGNRLGIDPVSITWPRVIDVNDRALRQMLVGLGPHNGYPRQTRFDSAAESEVMAIVGVSRSLSELRQRLAAITVGYTRDRHPVSAGDLGVAGAMAVVLKDALLPNLLQTIEHTPMLVHTGPYGNVSQGNPSVLADLAGLKLADYVVTESGFGAEMGFEKFMDIKCRASGVFPDVAVMVCTVRALKMHAGGFHVAPGRPLDPRLLQENLAAVEQGMVNLEKQIENVRLLGVPVVVAINRFSHDTQRELDLARELALRAGAVDAQVGELWQLGGEGGEDLARAVIAAVDSSAARATAGPRFLYPLETPIKEKIRLIATNMYGADGVFYLPEAERQIRRFTELGLDRLPICMAKTQYSLSDDASLKGRPSGFQLTVREVRACTGAGFLCVIAGEIVTMPGLPSHAAYQEIDLDENGQIVGLF